ncbi:beta-galactosidase [Candidatus Pseudothioglobus sp. Uisw_086]|uniref:beta-galactosidase n=1 Tax=Candidatus Pseudothioglobus sp. Uisw_086 TaxID=3230998 RepID=UPI003A8836DC
MIPKLGSCYYPEHWSETQWEKDAKDMIESGLTWVRIGEFAWSRLEPEEGAQNFKWLDQAIEVLGNAGLNVVMSTPTAAPPRWVVDKWPDMLLVDSDGRSRKFGSRRHYCFSHQGYLQESSRITRLVAKRYGKNPYIKAWQLDNEYGCHDTTLSFSNSSKSSFKLWLSNKYKTIKNLNESWSNVFWSMEYNSFEQIELPNLTVTDANPIHELDFRRFSSEQVVKFNRAQVLIMREHTKMPLIHNYMGKITDFDHYEVGSDLDIASWDSYPLGFLEDRSTQNEDFKLKFMRFGDPDFQAFHHDLYRTVGRGRWWVMEQQPGPVNWAPYNPEPASGAVRLWSWEAIAHGAEVVSYFRWRQAPFAQEQMHAGLQRPDGESAPGLTQASQVNSELKEFDGIQQVQSKVAIIFDYESCWAWEIQPQGKDFSYFELVYEYYKVLRSLGLSVDILPPNQKDLTGYKIVLAPGLMHFDTDLKAAIQSFEGVLISGPRSGSKTLDMSIPKDLPPEVPGVVGTVASVESLRPNASISIKAGGSFNRWMETLVDCDNVIEECEDGRPAVIGQTNRLYLTGWGNQEALTRIFRDACLSQNISTMDLPDCVRVRETHKHRFWFNYSEKETNVSSVSLPPSGVFWEPL